MVILRFIRHGETAWNREGRWQGHTDIPLNDSGLEQSRRLAAQFAEQSAVLRVVDCLYSSDLTRAWQTAEILGAALKIQPRPLTDLREMDVGKWGGLSDAEVQQQFPEEWRSTALGENIARGGGERFSDLMGRAVRAIEFVISKHDGERVGLVTHGGIIRAAMLHVQRLTWSERQQLPRIENTSSTTIVFENGSFRLEAANDVSHLPGLKPAVDMMAYK